MKVLLLNQVPEVNNKYTFSLARALSLLGTDIAVCGMESDNYIDYSDVKIIGIFESYNQKDRLFDKVISYNKSWKKVVNYCVQEKVEIVHVQWYIFSPLDWYYHKLLRKKGMKVITTIHDLLPFNRHFYDFYFHKKIYSKSDLVISQARMNYDSLINDFHVQSDRVVYIPHGHYMEYSERLSKQEGRMYLGVDNDVPLVLFFGQIKKVKGLDILIRAMKIVSEKYPKVKCVIAGKEWKDDYSVYKSMIDEDNTNHIFKSFIRFIRDDEIKYFFSAADIVALPYRQIYQSGVVLLAFAYEKPIVATSEGEFLTVIKDRETGLLVPSDNIAKLAEAIIWYIENPNDASLFARNGKKDIEVRLSWSSIAESLHKEYVNTLNRNE